MNIRLDATQVSRTYSAAFRRLRELPGFDHQVLLRAEMGSILKAWAGKTKVGTAKQADFRARYRAGKAAFGDVGHASSNPYSISVNTGLRGGYPGEVWFRTRAKRFQQAGRITNAGKFIPAFTHFRASDWSRINEGAQAYAQKLATLLPNAIKSVGLARQSVVQIADALKIDLNSVSGAGISSAGIAKARAAIASSGVFHQNGFGNQDGDAITCYIEGITRLPYGRAAGLDTALDLVMVNRAKYIETSYRKGAFDSIARVQRAFPNVFKTL
jgi:hypothetical protein